MPTVRDARVEAFRQLHREVPGFVIPNAWTAGTARYLASEGFQALATTSAGLAFDLGRPDAKGQLGLEETLRHVRDIVEATPLPVNADFENGYARSIAQLETNVRLCVGTGVAGLSIEDATGDLDRPLFPLEEAVERVRAARRAIDATGTGVLLTARAESFLVGAADPLRDVTERLAAYSEAGADVLFAPGLQTLAEVATIVAAVHPKPVNVLAVTLPNVPLEVLQKMGVARVSLGSALARVGWAAVMRAARQISEGRFDLLAEAATFAEMNALFGRGPESVPPSAGGGARQG